MKKTILCAIGTRPEVIKMAPVILALRREGWANVRVLVTAQHREILDQQLNYFGIVPDIDLNIMRHNQDLTSLTARLMLKMGDTIKIEKPDAVLVQGDTTTVMALAVTCFYHKIAVGHIEAGLRTWNIQNPFPEEFNRVVSSRLARWHFTPTYQSKLNLLEEGINEEYVIHTGNTVIDSLLFTINSQPELPKIVKRDKPLVIVTIHRRENIGESFRNICQALRTLAKNNSDIQFFYPAHPNSNFLKIVNEYLMALPNFIVSEPLAYPQFIALLQQSQLILSDSGGVQEEATFLKKRMLILRENTERPESLEQGAAKLIGTSYDSIVEETQLAIECGAIDALPPCSNSPFGDGKASNRIVKALRDHFKT